MLIAGLLHKPEVATDLQMPLQRWCGIPIKEALSNDIMPQQSLQQLFAVDKHANRLIMNNAKFKHSKRRERLKKSRAIDLKRGIYCVQKGNLTSDSSRIF